MEFGVKKVAVALFSFLIILSVYLLAGVFVESFSFLKLDNPTFAIIMVPAFFLGFILPDVLTKYFGEELFGFELSVPIIFVFLTIVAFSISISIFLPALYGNSNLGFSVDFLGSEEKAFSTQQLADGTAKSVLTYNPLLMLLNSAMLPVLVFGFFGILIANMFNWFEKLQIKN